MLVQLVAAAKIVAVKMGTSVYPTHQPCQPTCPALGRLLALDLVDVDFL